MTEKFSVEDPRTLTDFIDAFARYSLGSDYLICYRGQRNYAWQNVAAIFRPELKRLLDDEKRAIRDLISVQPHEFASDETMFDKLVRMQHFGLPTRLLDVSRNALVALYFATDPGPDLQESTDGVVTIFAIPRPLEKYYDSDAVSCLSNLANMTTEEKAAILKLKRDVSDPKNIEKFNKNGVIERLQQFIRSEKPYFLPIIDPVDLFTPYYVHTKMSNRRILAQAGAFILFGLDRPANMYFPNEIEEKRFRIPKEQKETIRGALDALGINESTLYPEIDKAAAWLKNRYLKRIKEDHP